MLGIMLGAAAVQAPLQPRRCRPTPPIRCQYVSEVSRIVLCRVRLLTTAMSVPAASINDAAAWRSECRLTGGGPCLRTSAAKRFVT